MWNSISPGYVTTAASAIYVHIVVGLRIEHMNTFGIQFHAVTFCRLCVYYTQKQLCQMPSGRLLVQWAKVPPTTMNWNQLPFSLPSPIIHACDTHCHNSEK